MDIPSPDTATTPPSTTILTDPSLSRRRFLRGAAVAGGGLLAAGVAACAPAASGAGWTFGPGTGASTPAPGASSPTPMPSDGHPMDHSPSPPPSGSAAPVPPGDMPEGWTEHDVKGRAIVRRFLGDLVPALPAIYPEPVVTKLGDILSVADGYPELEQKPAFAQVPNLVLTDAVNPLTPNWTAT